MFKFFRNIRKLQLLNGNSLKYLKYAIGEIALIMLGILLAFQVNTWNESRKANEKERNLFKNLIIDFEFRRNELKEFNIARKKAIASILRLNNIIAGNEEIPHPDTLDGSLASLVNGLKFNENFEMLDVVFNTGLINDIKSEALKRELIEWPQKVEEMLEEQRMINKLIDTGILPYLSNYVSIRDIYENFDFRKYNLPKGEPVSLRKDYNHILSDPIFENYLARLEMLIRVTAIDSDILISSAERIIVLLKENAQ